MKTETNTSHFANTVPQALREKLYAFAEYVKEDFISDFGGMGKEPYGCADINAIYGHAISGFVPFQNGGFEVSELYADGWGCGSYFCEGERISSDESYIYMLECFARDESLLKEGEDSKEWAKAFSWEDAGEEIQNKLQNYKAEWFEPVLLRLEAWVTREDCSWSETEPTGVIIQLSCNYRDAPYYRSEKDTKLHELTLSIAEFEAMQPADIIKRLTEDKESEAA